MRKFLSIITFAIAFFVTANVFATTNQYIEFSSGETDDNAIYLDSYEDYLNALQGVDEQALYKEDYLNTRAQEITSYDLATRPDVVKAVVLEVDATEEYYSYDTYGTYKITYQPIKIQVLEGKYKNETFDISYVLTADTYENLDIKPVKANQRINVVVYEEEGETYAYATTVDSSISRSGYGIAVIILAVVFIFIYLGRKGFKVLPQLILIADILLVIFVPEIITGRSIIWLTIVTLIAYLITDTALKVGLNAKMFASLISTIAVVLITTMGLILFNNATNMSGIIYEATSIVETFPKGTIDFYDLNLAIYILMATIVVSDISCKVINTYDEKSDNEAKEEVKEYVASKIPTISGILLITLMPKYLYMLISKYTYTELINSEMLTNEIVRILFLIISMTVTTQVAVYVKKLFVENKK